MWALLSRITSAALDSRTIAGAKQDTESRLRYWREYEVDMDVKSHTLQDAHSIVMGLHVQESMG